MELTPRQRAGLQRLLEQELRAALTTARDGGASGATIDATIADRTRVLDELLRAFSDDPQDPLHENGTGDGVGEQR